MTWRTALAIAALAVVAAFFGGLTMGKDLKQDQWDRDKLAREQKAREVEASWAEQIAKARSTRDDEIDRINGRLADALERLRKRPDRLPEIARATCEGSTGKELAAGDAGFLERYAAEAARQQAALSECYAWVEAVKGAK